MATSPIRALVIDDSVFSRRAITKILESSPLVEVVGVARDGEDALAKVFELAPDVITLDLEMPRMDGFTFLRIVMSRRPTPVIVVSSRSGDAEVFKALELGAVDFVAKPAIGGAGDNASIERELLRKVHATRGLQIEKVRERIRAAPPRVAHGPAMGAARVVAIGASTGGPAALMQIFGAFPEAPPIAFLVSQHMPAGFTADFAERLDRLTPLRAVEARGGEAVEPGTILLAPGGRHLELQVVERRLVAAVAEPDRSDKYTPSIDRLFESAAKHVAGDLLAVVLTGMGDDGRRGAAAVRAAGGRVIAESRDTALIFGMPQQAIRAGAVDWVMPLNAIPTGIQSGEGESHG
jgi:two-component system chemotaxis response regulator CheB